MPSSGVSPVTLTAIVLDASRQAISGQTVTFSTGTDPSAFINNVSASGVSDANGIVTAQLNLGSSKANRAIDTSATTGTISATNAVNVTGTTISVSGNSSLAFNASTTLNFSVKDSAGNVLPNTTVSVASQAGNTITPATGVTGQSGTFAATVTATQSGSDVITATAAGASATQALTVSADSFAFTTPTLAAGATSIDIPLNTAPAISVNWTKTSAAQVGQVVSFSASRGTVAGSPSTTNATGDTPGVTISSTSAGPAIITASGPGGTPAATLNVVFVATSASSATVQPNPGTVQVTTGSASQTNNSSTISVVVRDASNNLVKNAAVSFSITNDPTGGYLLSSSGITDVSGTASVTYVAGGISSAQNGVNIAATVSSVNGVALTTPVTGSTSLTVSGQSLQVQLGTDNLVGSNPPTNSKTYVAIVTDAAGNPVVGATVQFQLRPGQYRKGTYVLDPTGSFWLQNVTATCPNEDLNFNGILDPGEGLVAFPAGVTPTLRPGDVASVTASGITDASGIATATITYAKNYSSWVEETLQASTTVVTNTPPAQAMLFLPGLASDYQNIQVAPPGQTSPYGKDNTCADTL